jgi:hypothetical protein
LTAITDKSPKDTFQVDLNALVTLQLIHTWLIRAMQLKRMKTIVMLVKMHEVKLWLTQTLTEFVLAAQNLAC